MNSTQWLCSRVVAIHKTNLASYPATPPFHPSDTYPEMPFAVRDTCENDVYAAVRSVFMSLGFDRTRIGTPDWNPLGDLIRPGDHVVLKPNLIRESHQLNAEWQQVVTHGSVVRAVLDYVVKATGEHGRVTIADGPQTDADFEAICSRTGLAEITAFFAGRGFQVELRDFRRERWLQRGDVIQRREVLSGDPAGYTRVNLGSSSEFLDYRRNGHFYGADYDTRETASFHSDGRHEYVISRTAMDADVFINLPKLKTHKKVGVTLSLKNLVGINGLRNCLPHHTIGTPDSSGDEFPDSSLMHKLQSRAVVTFKRALVSRGGTGNASFRLAKHGGRLVFGDTQRVIRSGNWHGNDTAWRMVLDLNKVFFHFTADATPSMGRRYLTLVDGIVGGEGNGPVAPDARPAGLLVAGCNPVAVDTVCATLMGFDYKRIPMLSRAWSIGRLPLVEFDSSQIRCVSNVGAWSGDFGMLENGPHLSFRPHFGWVRHMERGQA